MPIVTQQWTHSLTCMQQTVLISAVRGPDGIAKYHPAKLVQRWYRRCVLLGALDHNVFEDPIDPRGGSFTGPSVRMGGPTALHAITGVSLPEHYQPRNSDDIKWLRPMDLVLREYFQNLDSLPYHFITHFMHAGEIIAFKHPDTLVSDWWRHFYLEMCNELHVKPETEGAMDRRLGDNEAEWRKGTNAATQL